MSWTDHITSDPKTKRGAPVVTGTRLTLRAIAVRLERGERPADLHADFPHVPLELFTGIEADLHWCRVQEVWGERSAYENLVGLFAGALLLDDRFDERRTLTAWLELERSQHFEARKHIAELAEGKEPPE